MNMLVAISTNLVNIIALYVLGFWRNSPPSLVVVGPIGKTTLLQC